MCINNVIGGWAARELYKQLFENNLENVAFTSDHFLQTWDPICQAGAMEFLTKLSNRVRPLHFKDDCLSYFKRFHAIAL